MRFQTVVALLARIVGTVVGVALSLAFGVVAGYFINWFLGLFILIVGLLMASLDRPEPPQNAEPDARGMRRWLVPIGRTLVAALVLVVWAIGGFPAGAYALVLAWFIWIEWLEPPCSPRPEADDF